jgi:hypothetical protein
MKTLYVEEVGETGLYLYRMGSSHVGQYIHGGPVEGIHSIDVTEF